MRDTLVEMENRLKSRLENDLSSLKESIGGDISSIHQLLKKKLWTIRQKREPLFKIIYSPFLRSLSFTFSLHKIWDPLLMASSDNYAYHVIYYRYPYPQHLWCDVLDNRWINIKYDWNYWRIDQTFKHQSVCAPVLEPGWWWVWVTAGGGTAARGGAQASTSPAQLCTAAWAEHSDSWLPAACSSCVHRRPHPSPATHPAVSLSSDQQQSAERWPTPPSCSQGSTPRVATAARCCGPRAGAPPSAPSTATSPRRPGPPSRRPPPRPPSPWRSRWEMRGRYS